ncbi:MAG TPA: response regulator transcription factor [Candidatus Limnocylindria bacterium]|jgi:DNA-binding response OmpR family regulator
MKVLLVEDDADLLDLMTYALSREGYTVLTAMDGQQALKRWEEESPDLLLLDANIPKIDGFEVCRRIRHDGATPIIMLTARDEEEDVLHAYRLGVDDFVNKPFSARQLTARMKAVLRRSQADPYRQAVREVKVGNVRLDLQSYTVNDGDRQIQFTPLEFRILYLLGVNEGRVIPYSRLVEYAWGYEGGDSSLLKTHICHIRQKLNLSAGKNGGIRAVPGVGYSLALS